MRLDGIASIISVLSMAFMVFAIIRTLMTFRQERPVKKLSQYVAMATPVMTLLAYLLGTPQVDYPMAIIVAGGVGLALGLLWSRTTRLHVQDDQVFGRNTTWWLVFWGLSFVLTQGMALVRQMQVLSLSYVLLALSSGVAVGVALGLLRGLEALSASSSPAGAGPPPSSKHHCEKCGSPVSPGSAFCEQCGQRLD
jgi:hypothetical protein